MVGYIIILKSSDNHTKIKYYHQQLMTYKNDINAQNEQVLYIDNDNYDSS